MPRAGRARGGRRRDRRARRHHRHERRPGGALPRGGGFRSSERSPPSYDAMIGKLIAHGADRADALGRMEGALAETVIKGIRTNILFHRRLLQDPKVREGGPTTHHLEALLASK
ncbi:MAG: hypothetical protein QM699_01335 [Amaricoccus sp.]